MSDDRSSATAPGDELSRRYGVESAENDRLTIAVVGSGPSGCYAAAFLSKSLPGSEITIFESLPTPYGLVRYGVAADHQGSKNVTRQFDRLFTRDGVRFAGNVCVGTDVDFADLAGCFDVVVLATGLPQDRTLDVPYAVGARVVGAGSLLRALNGHPTADVPRTEDGDVRPLGREVVVIGMGNVAIDVVRLLSKDADELHGSDIDDDLLACLRPSRPATIDVLGRSPASRARFDLAMLRELLSLPNIDVAVTGLSDDDESPAAAAVRARVGSDGDAGTTGNPRTLVRLHFGVVPEAVDSTDGRTRVRATAGDARASIEFSGDCVITAVGFVPGAEDDLSCPTEEWSGDHVYRVGWLSRGAQGAIPENRKHARQIADAIIHDVQEGRVRPGRPGFAAASTLLRDVVTFTDWQRIEEAEQMEALPGRCRRKITDRERLLRIATVSVDRDPPPARTLTSVASRGTYNTQREFDE